MKFFNILAFVFSVSLTNAQTPLIAHKSHTGKASDFFIDPSSNFGAIREQDEFPPKYRVETYKPLNDSIMVREISDQEQKVIQTDTFPNKKKYSPPLFQHYYQDSIRKEERLKIYQEELKREEEQKKQLQLQQEQINDPASSKKKEKKSYLLFLFGITGGGMLLMRLFSKSRITKPSIA